MGAAVVSAPSGLGTSAGKVGPSTDDLIDDAALTSSSSAGPTPGRRLVEMSRLRDEDHGAQSIVTLNVYDLNHDSGFKRLNRWLEPLDMGFFHCGVEVCGVEWSYCCVGLVSNEWNPIYGESPAETGVYSYLPRRCPEHSFRESMEMGRTCKPPGVILRHLRAMRHEWVADEYDLLERNCCHFCLELCRRLGLDGVPEKVLRLPRLAKTMADSACCCDASAIGRLDRASCGADTEQAVTSECSSPCGVPLGANFRGSGKTATLGAR
mmetsp:Transcript_26308/g.52604  ORF Transcript_26308/g.52604 Transcript_26308/m.52604 type:complete len:266 (-) Transcript_26308:87-884(-)